MTEPTVLFVASGPRYFASARFRAFWISDFMDEAICVNGQANEQVEVPDTIRHIVWGKAFSLDFIKATKGRINHYWDLCDPLFWFSPDSAKQMDALVDRVVVPTSNLAWAYKEAFGHRPMTIISDRFDLSHYNREHVYTKQEPIEFGWFGTYWNRIALYPAIDHLDRLYASGVPIRLTVIDDRPDIPARNSTKMPIIYKRWDLNTECKDIAEFDFNLIPPYPGLWGTLKSNNRAVQAGLLGVVSTTGMDYEELVNLTTMSPEALNQWGRDLGRGFRVEYDITKSVEKWRAIFDGHSL